MEKHKLDKLFSDKLQSFEQVPAINSWEQLAQKLEKKDKRNIWPILGIAASAALVVLSSWYMLSISSATDQPTVYAYADGDLLGVEVPVKIVFVPIIIQIPSQTVKPAIVKESSSVMLADETKSVKMNVVPEQNDPREHKSAKDMALNTDINPILQEPLPVFVKDNDEVIIAAARQNNQVEANENKVPLTIIYKQGTPANKSKFTQAISYMEDVRNGDKKLNVFKKLRENIETKFNSNKGQNSK